MSVRTLQIQRVLRDVVRALYGTGQRPTLNEVQKQIAIYFSQFPAGKPLPTSQDFITPAGRTDVTAYNTILAHVVTNIDVLYEACLEQVDSLMELSAVLQAKLDRLQVRRDHAMVLVDDYLLGLYNTDGYFFSVGDTFSTADQVDLSLTSAFIDTTIGAAILPTISSLTKHVSSENVTLSAATVATVDPTGKVSSNIPFRTVSPFRGAVDGLTNSFWAVEVETTQQQEVVCALVLHLGSLTNVISLSRIDLEPHGISPVQAFVETTNVSRSQPSFLEFGNSIQTNISKMSFIDARREADTVRITLRKTQPDYTDQSTGSIRYRYIFGMKEISIVENVYDNTAMLITTPLSIPNELSNDRVIDAVSLSIKDRVPPDTSIKYYVAQDNGETNPALGDFDWSPIKPVGTSDNPLEVVVRYNGVEQFAKSITAIPKGNDLQLIPFDATNNDFALRNPSPSLIADADTYRLCVFDEDFATNSLKLQEGINATRIWYVNFADAVTAGLGYWAQRIQGPAPPPTRYGSLSSGQAFFNGADVGESGKSVYIETYLNVDHDPDAPYVAQLLKADPNSELWNVSAYLNGRLVGSLPVGTNKLLIPWTFKRGLNHVSLLADIPLPNAAAPNPYLGSLKLFDTANLFDLGTVLLANWDYVSLFDLQYNVTGEPTSFALIKNGEHTEIITRRRPTSDFRLQYAKPTRIGPSGVRVRADFTRTINNPYVGPRLDEYRLRFSYGQASL